MTGSRLVLKYLQDHETFTRPRHSAGNADPATFLAQDKVFDWVRANDEVVQLDPSDFHGGRIYRPGPNGGNMHVDIQAKQPVTVAMVAEQQWHAAVEHDLGGRLDFRCMREHVVSTTYTCELPPSQPMVLVMRDERSQGRRSRSGRRPEGRNGHETVAFSQ